MQCVDWVLIATVFFVSQVACQSQTDYYSDSEPIQACSSETIIHYANTTGVEFSSPYFPGYPQSNLEVSCRYRVYAQVKGNKVGLEFIETSIADTKDCISAAIRVYDGLIFGDPLLKKFCGSELPTVFTSTGDVLFIYFHAKNYPGQGFTARVFEIEYGSSSGTSTDTKSGTSTDTKSGTSGASSAASNTSSPSSFKTAGTTTTTTTITTGSGSTSTTTTTTTASDDSAVCRK